jgi:heme exporter protein D
MNPWGFIAAAYLVTAVVLAGLIVWLAVDRRLLTRRLAVLDARGVRRRSASAGPSQ